MDFAKCQLQKIFLLNIMLSKTQSNSRKLRSPKKQFYVFYPFFPFLFFIVANKQKVSKRFSAKCIFPFHFSHTIKKWRNHEKHEQTKIYFHKTMENSIYSNYKCTFRTFCSFNHSDLRYSVQKHKSRAKSTSKNL